MVYNAPPDNRLKAKPNMRRWTGILFGVVALYLLVAYLIIPMSWQAYERRHPSFDHAPRITQTSDGHPGDPLNIALIGTKTQIKSIMQNAKWYPAAPLGLKSDLKIAADTVLSHPDDTAPVSSLYLFGRKEDLAFEQPVGDNPRKRHHVRFWKTGEIDQDSNQPIWIGSASFDERVGLSHTTGQITHRISADIDAERDYLLDNLKRTGDLAKVFAVNDFHTIREGRNGGGDTWRTDGRLVVVVISAEVTKEGPKEGR